MNLEDWLRFGCLKGHKTSRHEIADLFAVADRDLKACQTSALAAVVVIRTNRTEPHSRQPTTVKAMDAARVSGAV